ncbi:MULTISPECIES: hypothetical protein [unclassified Rhodococcus (in: high G+C Gram-positive bacteria)]|uniref:hypothetical protein n=1 Tax=unclassified Rhodococcus (in: high G+C Gram-positive bacteria) TaxID=192944 RepID=UPI00068F99D8|nr:MULTISPECIES: hypothetical protein [unclassified Rhodococcus (in: high G+C Gram-positive bacteria)]MBY6678773.1 hypothetical protein [Rhodococcus sp. BP-332]MBY6683212.1 hypothetical protein [Rhodococcus sp. BP-316]
MTAYTAVALTTAAIVALVVSAMFVPGVAKVFLLAQSAYWSLSYVARPLVLLWTLPQPQFADSLADPRLANIGYDIGIAEVLKPVVFGLWFYVALVVGYVLFRRWRRGPQERTTIGAAVADPYFFRSLGTIYVLGLGGRFVSFATGNTGSAGEVSSSNPLLDFAATMATVGALGLIVFARPEKLWQTAVLLLGLMGMELVWTVIVESKTPVLGAALAVAVRFALIGWTRGTILGVLGISAGAIGAFGILQSLKVDPEARAISAAAEASYPPVVQPFLPILRRFDLLEAATDAYYMQGREWISHGDVVKNALLNFIPSQLLGSEKFQSGTAWANQVRGSSVDMRNVSVSLAEGNISEGFVFGGYAGVAVTMTFTFVMVLVAVRWLLARNFLFVVLGLTLIEYPVLFERGILGTTESIGKSLQLAILVWIVTLLVGEYSRQCAETPPPTTHVPDDISTLDRSSSKGSASWV